LPGAWKRALVRETRQPPQQGARHGRRQGNLPQGDGTRHQHEEDRGRYQTNDGTDQGDLAGTVEGRPDRPGNGGGGREGPVP
jgi:hypothetical protein